MTSVEEKLEIQVALATRIIGFRNSTLKTAKEKRTVGWVKTQLEAIEAQWKQFFQTDLTLMSQAEAKKDHQYFATGMYDEAFTEYTGVKNMFFNMITPGRSQSSVQADQAADDIQMVSPPYKNPLPPISLPKFSGKKEEWEHFKGMFIALVHDVPSFPPILKLQYLAGSLEGDAKARLPSPPLTGEIYDGAWKALVEKYDAKKYALSTHISNVIKCNRIKKRTLAELTRIVDTMRVSQQSIKNLNVPEDKIGDMWMIHHVFHKLDFRTLIEWEKEADDLEGDYSSYDDFLKFLEKEIRILDAAQTSFEEYVDDKKSNSNQDKTKSVSAHQVQVATTCVLCKSDHFLYSCPKFKELPLEQKLDFCDKQKLCTNCLRVGHYKKKCTSPRRCYKCKEKHNTHLHDNKIATSSTSKPDLNTSKLRENHAISSENSEVVSTHTSHNTPSVRSLSTKPALLGTARVTLADSYGNQLVVRALIDPGSQRSFMSERVLLSITPKLNKVNVTVTGVGSSVTTVSHKEAAVVVKSPNTKDFSSNLSVYVLDKLTRVLPNEKIDCSNWPHIQGITLADPAFCKPDKVDCLLGADIYNNIILPGLIKGPGTPVAQQTVFGWILTGAYSSTVSSTHAHIQVYHTHVYTSLDSLLTKFWEVEEIPKIKYLTQEEKECEEYFSKTVSRQEDGRYVVRLPLKRRHSFVGSRKRAAACFFCNEKKRKNNPQLAAKYKEYILDYLNQGHMELVPAALLKSRHYYIPHQNVPRADKSDKIRIVFNASLNDEEEVALNGVFLKTPKLQKSISHIILRWMFYEYVYTTDIIQMFRQIVVHEEDRDFQRCLWREDADQTLQDARITRVVQGTAAAPYLALRVMQQLAIDEEKNFPEAASVLNHQVYVDDIFGGGDDMQSALEQREQLIGILASAGMSLGKWAANYPDLLREVAETTATEVDVHMDEVVSTLGIKWVPKQDHFIMVFNDEISSDTATKRTILSTTAKLYDPLGWIAPVIAVAKILLQDLWLSNLEWDEPITTELHERWLAFSRSLLELPSIKIPRWIGFSGKQGWTLHGFADASKRMYAAVIYAVKPNVTTHILIAKTKLAPTTVQTLPRLELNGAELLAKLTKDVLGELPYQPTEIHFRSDSRIVLDWLQGHPSLWTTFVANRVSTITSLFPGVKWKHVRSADNPADCATRGLSPSKLAEHRLWWQTPEWIIAPQEEWPQEKKVIKVQAHTAELAIETNEPIKILEKHSNFYSIQRLLAYWARWKINSSLLEEARQNQEFTAREWSTAEKYCFKIIQEKYYSNEIQMINKEKVVSRKSSLYHLSPFVDQQGLLRVGGRLEYANVSFNERHPIILPGNSAIVQMYIRQTHEYLLHGGMQLVLSHLYRKVWITQAPRVVKNIVRSCVRCKRYNANTSRQQMAPLPSSRITPQRAFAVAGLDYAGPFQTLFSKGRGAKSIKSYIAIFICFVTKAIHVEVVSDLATKAFIAAFDRFTSRRGVCSKLYSDNATTFKGAAKELDIMFKETSEFVKNLKGQLAIMKTDWNFIPPRTPHFGGLWEAAVNSFKKHFVRVVGESTFTFEELSTLAARIEACLNSRPLCPLSTEPSMPVALTPGHFLNGTPCLTPPDVVEEDERILLTDRWRLLVQLRNSFWTRWREEVMHHLHKRSKWIQPQRNFQVGDVAILKDELTPPGTWPLGLVTEIHKGKDGLVRAVTLKTATGNFVRPVIKLIKIHPDEAIEELHKLQQQGQL